MINTKIWKKRINAFFISKYFFSFLLANIFLYIAFSGYSYIKISHNKKAFSLLYDLLERYKGSVNSTSLVPLEELIKEIESNESQLGFFCSIKDQFTLLKASILLQTKKSDEALVLLNQVVTQDINNELNYLYQLVIAITYATSNDINKKQQGIMLLKKYASLKQFQDVALFYYGYFLLKTTSLKQADEAWAPLKNNPKFNNSPYKTLIEQARNCDY